MIVGPLIAVLSFVCSVGNVPLAAVLWSGGISFGGVMAFIFADLIVLPIIAIYRKYYGSAVRDPDHRAHVPDDGRRPRSSSTPLFTALGLVPDTRPTRDDIFGTIQLDYKLVLNVLGLVVFAALFGLTLRRGATDPVCGMRVDRAKAVRLEQDGTTYYFCSEHCRQRFQAHADRSRRRTRYAARPTSSRDGATGR